MRAFSLNSLHKSQMQHHRPNLEKRVYENGSMDDKNKTCDTILHCARLAKIISK